MIFVLKLIMMELKNLKIKIYFRNKLLEMNTKQILTITQCHHIHMKFKHILNKNNQITPKIMNNLKNIKKKSTHFLKKIAVL